MAILFHPQVVTPATNKNLKEENASRRTHKQIMLVLFSYSLPIFIHLACQICSWTKYRKVKKIIEWKAAEYGVRHKMVLISSELHG